MSASTTRLSLTKPGGGSTGLITPPDIVDIDVLNANFDKIDAAIGAQIVLSTALPSTPFAGQFVMESDTGNLRVYSGGQFQLPNNTPVIADLAALPSPTQFEGRTVHVDSMNVDFEAKDGVWVQLGPAYFPDITTRDTEYAKAAAAYRIAGVTCIITSQPLVTMIHNGLQTSASAGWQKLGLVKPSTAVAAASGTATINDDGSVTFVATAASNVILNNIFPPKATYGTDVFEVDIAGTSGAGASLTGKLAAGGVPDVATTNHDYYGSSFSQAGVQAAATSLGAAAWLISNAGAPLNYEAVMVMRHAGEAQETHGFLDADSRLTAFTSIQKLSANLDHRASTVFDGLQIAVSGAGTWTFKVRTRA